MSFFLSFFFNFLISNSLVAYVVDTVSFSFKSDRDEDGEGGLEKEDRLIRRQAE